MITLNLTEQQLKTLEDLGADFFSIEESAIAMELPHPALKAAIKDMSSDAHKAYYKGRMTEVARHRRNVKGLANMGSSPAQALVEKFIEKSDG